MVVEKLQVLFIHGGTQGREVARSRVGTRTEDRRVEDPGHLAIAMFVLMDAVDGPRLRRRRHLLAAGREEIDEEGPLPSRDLPHRLGVEGDAGVVFRAVGQARSLQVLVGDRRHEYDRADWLLAPIGLVRRRAVIPTPAWRCVAVDRVRILHERREILLELLDARRPGERLVEPEHGDEHVRGMIHEVAAVVVKTL